MEAVNPALQSAVLDKFAKPFANKTAKIVDNLDTTIEKQDIVVEKQDDIGKKIKKVVSDIESSGIKDAFARSSDGIKELSFGLLDIKGVLETVGDKFRALQDVVAPISEIGNFAFGDAGQRAKDFFLGDNKDKLRDTKSPLRQVRKGETVKFGGKTYKGGQMLPAGVDEDGQIIQMGLAKRLNNSFKGLFKSIGNITKAFGRLVMSLIPLTLKFLLFGGLFAAVAFGVGKLIQALGGWNFVESIIDNVVISLKSLELAFLKASNFFKGTEEKQNQIDLLSTELEFQKNQKRDKERIREIEEESKNDKGVIDVEKVKAQIDKEGLTSSKYGARVEQDEDTGKVTTLTGTGKVLIDRETQAKLDYLAIRAANELPMLAEAALKQGEGSKAEAAYKAAQGFIAEYEKTYGNKKLKEVLDSYTTFKDNQGMFQDKSIDTFLLTQESGGMTENLDAYNFSGGQGLNDFSRFISGSKKTGEDIKNQIDETKRSGIIDTFGQGGYLARISAPNIATQINNAYQLDAIPTSKESIADSS